MNIYELLIDNKVPFPSNSAIQAYFSSQLTQILTHKPEMHVRAALQNQSKWKSAAANPSFASLLLMVFIYVIIFIILLIIEKMILS